MWSGSAACRSVTVLSVTPRAFGHAKYLDPTSFNDLVVQQFAPVAETGSLSGPITSDYQVAYSEPRFSVRVMYDDVDGRVETLIEAAVRGRQLRARLSCLYVKAGLGAAQAIREIARSQHSLEVSARSQASALLALLPVLRGTELESLLLSCLGS